MKLRNYILDENKRPLLCEDIMKWGRWFEKSIQDRIVKQEIVGKYKVSTVFLGMDHGWGNGPPVLWETMVFEGEGSTDLDCDRCSGTWEQAEAMHNAMVEKVKNEK